jgi:hypothetical protein
MQKKAVLEIQMHWIFVIIAGAIILTFFIGIVAKQRSISRQELIFDINSDLNLLFSGAQVSEGSITEVDIPNLEIEFSCRDYWIEGQKKTLGAKPVFAPKKIEGDKILLWALAWKMPFKVDNFLYVTAPNIRYVFVDAPSNIYAKIPGKVDKEQTTNPSNLNDKGNKKIRFIIHNKRPVELSFPSWLKKYDVTALSVVEENRLEFYTYNNGWERQGSSFYLKEESLFGAIFSEDFEEYNCVMDKAVRELNAVAKIYAKRTEYLDYSSVCPLFYSEEDIRLFERIESETAGKNFGSGNLRIVEITDIANALGELNTDIEFQSCPVLY